MDTDPSPRPLVRLLLTLTAFIVLGGCEHADWDPTLRLGAPSGHVLDHTPGATEDRGGTTATTIALGNRGTRTRDFIDPGNATMVQPLARPEVDTAPGEVTLNFERTDLREVVRVILGEVLQRDYVLHPAVQGEVSLQAQALRREHLLPTLETMLRMNGAALVERGGGYQILPLTNALQGQVVPQLGESSRALPAGYSVQVVPLRYIGAAEMGRILEPLAPEGSILRLDTQRNLVVIAGTGPEMSNLLDTIRVFDVDWMAGLSVGFFMLEFAKAEAVVEQLTALLDAEEGGALAGVLRFVPIESANALLVVSPQQGYVERARDWIKRLDMAEASGESAERLFVYRVRHGDAEALAETLAALFGRHQDDGRGALGAVAPGLQRASLDEAGASIEDGAPRARAHRLDTGVGIVADTVNNSLLIKASARDYQKILDALKQLDIVPLQVLVEATIVEVTLTGNLEYGVQWDFFGLATADQRSNFRLDGTLDGAKDSGIGATFPGFTWSVISRPDTIRATLSALAGHNLVNVLSSPTVMVLDNQTARMQVGQQVPVATAQQQSTSTTERIVNNIEYRDTGVMLSVRPRVTPGGMVQMEIEQEVSTVATTESSNLDSPTFQTRNITSSVAVRSNQAVVLGGLIQDQREDGKQGLPGLYDLPIAGALFGERRKKANRTELVVILTPRVITSDQDLEAVTRDFRSKVKGLEF
ncbi:type II secretion system secretin GspD [Marichromatium bheemlicum]|uniref:Type II secretion system secretin GspD n=1 Tax=Marichromatium bheemlicum TaxID=365339 RepID=A0ABX1I8X8_9GAMM|nr:type II secretion system secretin GspD [Marichromatium bheemlicum]NKN32830.1 type II secretion system secretin GspD [Marichromatium bheemlicum]